MSEVETEISGLSPDVVRQMARLTPTIKLIAEGKCRALVVGTLSGNGRVMAALDGSALDAFYVVGAINSHSQGFFKPDVPPVPQP